LIWKKHLVDVMMYQRNTLNDYVIQNVIVVAIRISLGLKQVTFQVKGGNENTLGRTASNTQLDLVNISHKWMKGVK